MALLDVRLLPGQQLEEILDAQRLVAVAVNEDDAAGTGRLSLGQPGVAPDRDQAESRDPPEERRVGDEPGKAKKDRGDQAAGDHGLFGAQDFGREVGPFFQEKIFAEREPGIETVMVGMVDPVDPDLPGPDETEQPVKVVRPDGQVQRAAVPLKLPEHDPVRAAGGVREDSEPNAVGADPARRRPGGAGDRFASLPINSKGMIIYNHGLIYTALELVYVYGLMSGRWSMFKPAGIVGAALGVLLAVGPASAPAAAPDPVKDVVSISNYEKQVQDLNSQGLTLAFHLRIGNASAQPLFLTRYEYRVVIGQAEYLRLEVPVTPPIRIDPAGETLLSLPLKITYRLLFQAIPSLAGADKANCFLNGTMVFADERKREDKVPFVLGGEFPVFRDPAAALVSLRINDLTVAGADVAFQVRFVNANSYELFIDAIRFEASFGDYDIGSGDIPGDKNIEPRGARVFDLPFLISFFEVGQAVHGLLEGTAVPCRFRGEVDLSTVWGKITVPFDVRQTLPIVKPS